MDTSEDANEIAARPALKPVSSQAPQKLVVADTFSGRLLEPVKDRGGELIPVIAHWAKHGGCSTSHVSNALRDLPGAGHVKAEANRMGTVIS